MVKLVVRPRSGAKGIAVLLACVSVDGERWDRDGEDVGVDE